MAVPETVSLGFGSNNNMNEFCIPSTDSIDKMMSVSSALLNNCLQTPTASMVNLDSKSETTSIMLPICRFCHSSDCSENGDMLIRPCRCTGTLEFIHHACLMRWLEIVSRKSRKSLKCELCHYPYKKHKKFRMPKIPRVSTRDKICHTIFLLCCIGIVCGIVGLGKVLSEFDKTYDQQVHGELMSIADQVSASISGIGFLLCFLGVIATQVKSDQSLYSIIKNSIEPTLEWKIDKYDKNKDDLYYDDQIKDTIFCI